MTHVRTRIKILKQGQILFDGTISGEGSLETLFLLEQAANSGNQPIRVHLSDATPTNDEEPAEAPVNLAQLVCPKCGAVNDRSDSPSPLLAYHCYDCGAWVNAKNFSDQPKAIPLDQLPADHPTTKANVESWPKPRGKRLRGSKKLVPPGTPPPVKSPTQAPKGEPGDGPNPLPGRSPYRPTSAEDAQGDEYELQ